MKNSHLLITKCKRVKGAIIREKNLYGGGWANTLDIINLIEDLCEQVDKLNLKYSK